MCDICLKSPCDTRCPNAPEPPEIFSCSRCAEPIREGERYAEDPDGRRLCEGCMDNMTTAEALSFTGCVFGTAAAA